MQSLKVLSVTLLCFLVAEAQVIHLGKCPDPPVQQNFDVVKYLGRWYEIQKLPNVFQSGTCGQATYTPGDGEGVVSVLNEELLSDGTINVAEGTATVVDPSEPAKLAVTFYPGTPPGNYWVLDTDFDNYALVYGCKNAGPLYADFIWILSRSRSLPQETVDRLHTTLTSHGIKIDKLMTTPHVGCDSMPE
ncbi:apolipoprotein D-like [Engraulis encrasicolus]|uniref:apolipoprotein D-like n=1 Tax=Engraulis encrasicolus TaxID=184585 RepID=UPI002FD3C082